MKNLEAPAHSPEPDSSIDTLNEIYNLDTVEGGAYEPDFVETTPTTVETIDAAPSEEAAPENTDFYSKAANKLTNTVTRVSAWLEKRAAGLPARQEARAEKMETAKETVRKVGRGALRGAKAAGLFTLGMGVLTVELGVDSSVQARAKVMAIALEAQKRYDERAAYRMADQRAIENQDEAFDSYEPNIQLSEDHEEALEINDRMDAEQEERLNKLREARERKEAALARKASRKARRQEIYGTVRDKSSELYTSAKSHTKRFGRAAMKMFKRTVSTGRAAANAAVSAGKTAWNQSA